MWKSVPLLVVAGAILFILGVVQGGESATAATGLCGTSNASVSGPEASLFQQVNAWRSSSLGMPAMQLSGAANAAAQWFAEEMIAGRASGHTDSYYRIWNQRLKDCGYDLYWADAAGEALAGMGASDPNYGSTPEQALAFMVQGFAGESNGVQAQVPWGCGGVGYWSNPNPAVGQIRYAWVVVTAQIGTGQACPGAAVYEPSPTATPTTATGSATATRTATPTPTQVRRSLPMFACDSCVVATGGGTATPTPTSAFTATATPTPTPTPTPLSTATVAGQACGGALAVIFNMSKAGQWVQVSGSGDLTGWYLVSTNGGQRFNFPAGFTLAGSVKIYSTASAPALPDLWWGAAGIWDTFANDDAVLYDCANRAVSSFDDANAAAS